MSRPLDRHLTQDELDSLVSSSAFPGWESPVPEIDREGLSSHVANCETCRLRVEGAASIQKRLIALKSEESVPRKAECPPDDEWLSLVAGSLAVDRTKTDMQHAANCDHCGPLLRTAVEDFASDVAAGEESLTLTLQNSTRKWQKNLAKRLSLERDPDTHTPKTSSFRDTWRLYPYRPKPAFSIGSVALLLLVAVWAFYWWSPGRKVDRLLARAYTEQRTIELRIPGAMFAPLRDSRGPSGSELQQTPDLHEAESIIGRRLQAQPSDPAWLHAEARAYLLEGDYKSAIRSLERVGDVQPNSPSVLTDLATAFFLRAGKEGRTSDYGRAVDLLSRALAKAPDSEVALFNRAIVSERLCLNNQAINDWTRYLQIDPRGGLAKEAQAHLKKLQDNLQKRSRLVNPPLLHPALFDRAVRSTDVATWAAIEPEIEEYIRTAVVDWLPQATTSNEDSEPSEQALLTLSAVLRRTHHDSWLNDLLAEPKDANSVEGILALSTAIKANEAGSFSLALRSARDAESHFGVSKNVPGQFRSAVEEIYALHLSDRADTCLAKIAQISPDLADRHFPWIQTQLLIEESICLNMKGNVGLASEIALKAWKAGERAGYASLALRAEGVFALLLRESGEIDGAWNLCAQGLSSFWNSSASTMTGYNIYSYLDLMSEQQGEPWLNMAVDQQALSLISSSGDLLLRAEEHNRLARSAESVGRFRLAESEFSIANDLLSSAEDSETQSKYRLGAQIGLARVESRLGNNQFALDLILGLRARVSREGNRYLAADYFQTYGEIQAAAGHLQKAEEAFEDAIGIAELEANSLHSDKARTDWATQAETIYTDYAEVLLDEGKNWAALQVLESYRAIPLRSKNAPKKNDASSPLSPFYSGDQNRLRATSPRTTLIIYALLPHGIAIWLPHQQTVTVKRVLISPDSFRQLADRLADLCGSPTSRLDAVGVIARRGYAALIAPIEDYLPDHHTLVIDAAQRPFNAIPFQALMNSEGKYLIEEHPIVYSPASFYASGHKLDAVRLPARPLIVGNPFPGLNADASLRPLTDAWEEAQDISRQIPTARLLLGHNATLANVKRALPQATLFHFAGHTEFRGENVGLLLWREHSNIEGLLDSSEIEHLDLHNLNLVVLSACETENSRHGDPGDWESVAFGFIRAGVPRIVASRWSIDSSYSRALMNAFYVELLADRGVAGALADAQTQVMRGPGARHPYYWAGFDAFGTTEEVSQ